MDRAAIGKKLKKSRRAQQAPLICDGCGYRPPEQFATTMLEAHHIERRVDGGPDAEENLALLCTNCHRMAHCLFPCVGGYRRVPAREELLRALADPDAYLVQQKESAHQKIEAMLSSRLPNRAS